MNQQFTLPDGTSVGTGLIIPLNTSSAFPEYSTSGPLLSRDDIIDLAKSDKNLGRAKFDKSYNKNQGSYGSCNGFAGAAALTKSRVRRGLPRVDLSGAYLYSLINRGRDNGSLLEDGMAELPNGVATEQTVPFDKIYPRLYDEAKASAERTRFRGLECYVLRRGPDAFPDQQVFSALACGFDIVVAVHVNSAFMRLDRRGVSGVGNGPGNHAIACDGYTFDSINNELLADNDGSWGLSFGDQGRTFVTWKNHLEYTHNYHQFYAIRSTSEDPKNDSVPAVAG